MARRSPSGTSALAHFRTRSLGGTLRPFHRPNEYLVETIGNTPEPEYTLGLVQGDCILGDVVMLKCTAPHQQFLRSALPPISAASSCLLVSPSLPTAGLVLDAASLSPVCGHAERVAERTVPCHVANIANHAVPGLPSDPPPGRARASAQVLDCLRQGQHARRVRAIKAGRVCARVQRDCCSEVSCGAVGDGRRCDRCSSHHPHASTHEPHAGGPWQASWPGAHAPC